MAGDDRRYPPRHRTRQDETRSLAPVQGDEAARRHCPGTTPHVARRAATHVDVGPVADRRHQGGVLGGEAFGVHGVDHEPGTARCGEGPTERLDDAERILPLETGVVVDVRHEDERREVPSVPIPVGHARLHADGQQHAGHPAFGSQPHGVGREQ